MRFFQLLEVETLTSLLGEKSTLLYINLVGSKISSLKPLSKIKNIRVIHVDNKPKECPTDKKQSKAVIEACNSFLQKKITVKEAVGTNPKFKLPKPYYFVWLDNGNNKHQDGFIAKGGHGAVFSVQKGPIKQNNEIFGQIWPII